MATGAGVKRTESDRKWLTKTIVVSRSFEVSFIWAILRSEQIPALHWGVERECVWSIHRMRNGSAWFVLDSVDCWRCHLRRYNNPRRTRQAPAQMAVTSHTRESLTFLTRSKMTLGHTRGSCPARGDTRAWEITAKWDYWQLRSLNSLTNVVDWIGRCGSRTTWVEDFSWGFLVIMNDAIVCFRQMFVLFIYSLLDKCFR